MSRRVITVLAVLALALAALSPAATAADGIDRGDRTDATERLADYKLARPVTTSWKIDQSLLSATGDQRVIVRLVSESVAEAGASSRWAVDRANRKVENEQDDFVARLLAAAPSASVVASTQLVLNAVFIEVDAADLATVAADPAVAAIRPVGNYELDLTETVPYIGGTTVQDMGYDGTGISVAVLDSGVDYLHANLGGSGNPADYVANDPNIVEPGTFPTPKVVGGYDFVGSSWFVGGPPEAPDPDPLDDGPQAGHGTHVADIIGGMNGVAPGADIYGVKVCSSVSTNCSGIALIQGMEFAVDPNMDGNPEDAVDIINMSLGSDYGQAFDDDLSQAVEGASALGVLTVSSAGNGGDKPFINGTPSSANSALAVAQTNVPSAVLPVLDVFAPPGIAGQYPGVFQPWSVPLADVGLIEAPLMYGDGAGGNLNGCAPFGMDLTGYAVLVDRGACNFSLKISNISQAGGEVGFIGLVAPGDPFSGGDGGDRPIDIPGFMISQAVSNTLKSGLPDTMVRLDPNAGVPLIGSMVGSSSRGPSMEQYLLKPEIGAPGASVSAVAGSGTGEGPFGGTSGASPMVAGSAALLMQAYPDRSWAEIKSVLMNTGESDIINQVTLGGGDALAPISRIGGGEVRVDKALASPIAAWDKETMSGGLGFGFHEVDHDMILERELWIQNYTDDVLWVDIESIFRFAEDATSAVHVQAQPSRVRLLPHRGWTVDVEMKIDAEKLPENYMDSGSGGADASLLTMNEFDGYLYLSVDGNDAGVHVPWHVIPRAAASAEFRGSPSLRTNPRNGITWPQVMRNLGAGTATVDTYSVYAVSPDKPEGGPGEQSPNPDLKAVGIQTYPVGPGFCGTAQGYVLAIAVSQWEQQTHAIAPGHIWVDLDLNQDGQADYAVATADFSGFNTLSDGRILSFVVDWSDFSASAFFFAEHLVDTGTTVMYLCDTQIGGAFGDAGIFNPIDATAQVYDWYYGGPDDWIGMTTTDGEMTDVGFVFAPLGERFVPFVQATGEFFPDWDTPPGDSQRLTFLDFGPIGTDLGVLLVTNGDRGPGVGGAATDTSEALIVPAWEHRIHVSDILGD